MKHGSWSAETALRMARRASASTTPTRLDRGLTDSGGTAQCPLPHRCAGAESGVRAERRGESPAAAPRGSPRCLQSESRRGVRSVLVCSRVNVSSAHAGVTGHETPS